ncbi:hypothetical protein ACSBO6_09720 [Bacillus sp. AL-1R]
MSKLWKVISACALFIILLVISVNAISANNNDDYSSIKKFAWESLSVDQQNEVTEDWKEATVKKTKLEKKYGLFDEKYINKKVYAVTFKVDGNSLLGDITAYVSLNKKTFIGVANRE